MRPHLSKLPFPEIAILVLAIFLRVWLIEIKPPHFDEGVNGWFADRMTETGYYRYDPTNYHGPLHFYAVFLAQTLFGRELWAIRLPAILASLLCVGAILRFRDFFDRTTVRFAALAMAISPGFVFYGRYSIHESWQVLFSITLLYGILGLWRSGDRRSLFWIAGSLTGLLLTKETYILHAGCFALAALVLWGWQRVVPSRPAFPLAKQNWTRGDLATALAFSALAVVFFYSGTFHDFRAMAGLFETMEAWFHTGVKANGHEKSTYDLVGPLNWYWVALMARYEWPGLLGLAACVRYVFPSDARLRYIAISGAGTLLAYSIIPYKTPWCIISMLWPFCLLAGALLSEAGEKIRRPAAAWGFALLLLVPSFVSSLRLNFRNFTDDSEPYVYVQTYEDVYLFTGPLLRAAKADPLNYHRSGIIALESYYPLPWMLGDFTRIGYHGSGHPPDWNADFVAIPTSREREVEPLLRRGYFKRRFHLRSAQDECTAYFAADIYSPFFSGPAELSAK